MDSAQVYRDMDIGSGKPNADERAVCPHHLIDVVSPLEAYSAARFREECIAAVTEIRARGRIPLLVGGTLLYYKALRDGLARMPAADAALREEIRQRAEQLGWRGVHAELARRDPATAARLAPMDSQRIERALEVVLLTGKTLGEVHADTTGPAPFEMRAIALVPSDRALLHRRIEARFAAMLQAGLVEEVVGLRARYALQADLPSMRCVGYRQVWDYLEGAMDLSSVCERGVFATRALAKRQLTWLRAMDDLLVVDCLAEDAARKVGDLVQRVWAREAVAPTPPFAW
jgi:tRNA dimethylallyltransferase